MESYFLTMIQNARINEEVIIYKNTLRIEEKEINETSAFLSSEYANEALSYPYSSPPFNTGAAIWGASVFYTASQLLLHRKNKQEDLPALFPPFRATISSGAILSADLTLRFIPCIIVRLKETGIYDNLVHILENILKTWHYSGIRYLDNCQELNFDTIIKDQCLKQLYINRVIEYKNQVFASHPLLIDDILSSLSIYKNIFWPDFKIITK